MLNLLWGVKSINYDPRDTSTDQTVTEVNILAKNEGYVEYGDYIINLNAMPAFEKGITNTLRISMI